MLMQEQCSDHMKIVGELIKTAYNDPDFFQKMSQVMKCGISHNIPKVIDSSSHESCHHH